MLSVLRFTDYSFGVLKCAFYVMYETVHVYAYALNNTVLFSDANMNSIVLLKDDLCKQLFIATPYGG